MISRIIWMFIITATMVGVAGGAMFILANHGPLPLLIAAPVIYWLFRESHITPGILGTARIADFVDLVLSGLVFNRDGVLLGKIGKLPYPTLKQRFVALFNLSMSLSFEANAIFLADSRRGRYLRLPESVGMHVAYIAPTGQGKSAGFAISNLLTDPNSAIVLDYKAELIRETAWARMTKFNQDVVCYAPFGLPNGINLPTVRFNPLQLIDPASKLYLDHAASMAKSLVVREANEQQPYFNNASEMIITSILAVLMTEASTEECTLGELRNILSLPHRIEEITSFMMERASRYPAQMEQLAGPLMALQGESRFSVLSTINTHLRWLDSIPVAESLSETTFQPGQLFDSRRGMTIYIHIPVHLIHAYRGLTRVIFSSLINFIFQTGESRTRRIRFYLDESHGLGSNLDSLYAALVYGRSYGINLNFFFQAVSQIEEIFQGSRAKDFLSNVVPVFTGVKDMHTAREVSAWIGRQTVEVGSRQQSFNTGRSDSFQDRGGRSVTTSWGVATNRSRQEQSREVIQPEEILQLPEKTTIVTVPHTPPILARPPFYFEDRKLRRLARQSRKYALRQPGQCEKSWLARLIPWSQKKA